MNYDPRLNDLYDPDEPDHDPEPVAHHDPGAIPEPSSATISEQFAELESLIDEKIVGRARLEVKCAVLVNALKDIIRTVPGDEVYTIAMTALALVGEGPK